MAIFMKFNSRATPAVRPNELQEVIGPVYFVSVE